MAWLGLCFVFISIDFAFDGAGNIFGIKAADNDASIKGTISSGNSNGNDSNNFENGDMSTKYITYRLLK